MASVHYLFSKAIWPCTRLDEINSLIAHNIFGYKSLTSSFSPIFPRSHSLSWWPVCGLVIKTFCSLPLSFSLFVPSEAHLTNGFSSKIQIWCKYLFTLIHFVKKVIATNFCTCHGSCAVVACAKFCSCVATKKSIYRKSFSVFWRKIVCETEIRCS